MINIPVFDRVSLARMVIPLGHGRDGKTEPTNWTWLPANQKADAIWFRIPVKLLAEILAMKQAHLASAPPAEPKAVTPSSARPSFKLRLARIVLPIDEHPGRQQLRTAPDAPQSLTPEQSRDAEEIRKRLLMAAFGVINVRAGRDKPPMQGETKVPTFTIDSDNNITVFNSAEEAAQAGHSSDTHFDSRAALRRLSEPWPLSRLIDIWNSIPGERQVQTFPHRGKAVARIWKAIQKLGKGGSASEKPAAPIETSKQKPGRKRRAVKRRPTVKNAAKDSGRNNKKAAVIAMMKRAKGATLTEIMQATSWQAHTVRGFVSILGSKGGQKISSSKNAAGERTYRIAK